LDTEIMGQNIMEDGAVLTPSGPRLPDAWVMDPAAVPRGTGFHDMLQRFLHEAGISSSCVSPLPMMDR